VRCLKRAGIQEPAAVPDFNPDYAIENLLRAEIAANTAISSYFLFTVGVATLSKKILAGISVFIALSTLVTIPIA
jgi:hypothetical protein